MPRASLASRERAFVEPRAPRESESDLEDLKRRITTNFTWVLVAEAIGKAVFFATTILLARKLGVRSFGLFTLAQTVTYYLWLAASLGTDMYGIREVARAREHQRDTIDALFTMRLCAGLGVFALYVSVIFAFLGHIPISERLVFAGCGLYLPAWSFYSDWILRGLETFQYIAVGNLVGSGLFLLLVVGVPAGEMAPAVAAFGWSISFFVGGLALYRTLASKTGVRPDFNFNFASWRKHLADSIHFAVSGGLWTVYRFLPIVTVGALFTDSAMGIFSVSYRTITTLSGAGLLVSTAMYPVVSQLYDRADKAQFRQADRYFLISMLGIGIPIAIVGSVLAHPFMTLLFGTEYHASAEIFSILVWFVPLSLVRSKYSALIRATEYQSWQAVPALAAIATFAILSTLTLSNLRELAVGLLAAEATAVATFIVLAKLTYERFDEGDGIPDATRTT